MNTEPATEYAIYYPDDDRYMVDARGAVATFPRTTIAERAATKAALIPWEIHLRRNYTVTPWRPLSRVEPWGLTGSAGNAQ